MLGRSGVDGEARRPSGVPRNEDDGEGMEAAAEVVPCRLEVRLVLLPAVAAAASADADADKADDPDETGAAVAVAGRDDEEGGRCGVRLLPAAPDLATLPPLSA